MDTPPVVDLDHVPLFCPCCGLAIDEPEHAVMCGTCRTLHHLDCWGANSGCCVTGCPAAPRRASAAADTPTSGPSWSRTPPPTWTGPRLAQYGSWPWIITLLVLVVLLSSVFSLPVVAVLVAQTGDPMALLEDPIVLFIIIAIEDAVFVGVIYFLLIRRGVTSWREMGLRVPTWRSLGLGVFYGALFIAVSSAAELLLRLFGVEQTQASQFPVGQGGTAGTVAIWVAGIILAPITEEIFFRGFMFHAIAMRKGLARGIVYSSLVFGLVHLNVAAFLPISLGAALLAVGYHRSGDLWVPIIAHALNNLFAFLLLTLALGG